MFISGLLLLFGNLRAQDESCELKLRNLQTLEKSTFLLEQNVKILRTVNNLYDLKLEF